MSLASLSTLAQVPLRILLISPEGEISLTLAGLLQPLQMAAKILGPARLQLDLMPLKSAVQAPAGPAAQLCLLVSDDALAGLSREQGRLLLQRCQAAPVWGAAGAAVLWLARSGALDGARTALPWALYADAGEVAGRAILTPNLFELDGHRLSCCGGAASIDFALSLIGILFEVRLQAQVQEALCVERIRDASERQRQALQARFGALQPKLSEAVTLMESNIEEPLSTDDIANLVGLSRRQLERLFKQYLGAVPSRYYLELRLQRSRQLLLESHHSIVQIGLMCGFSSGSHFSTAYGALFGITPREQRQRKLAPGHGVLPDPLRL
ncbi:GlxA family transcriptional regulator [Herminiimonas sp. CN]|uniref:GlxA family transcriptional regulator n=1 Tax=Herminiimonas sp. CN TaxID=1349818 RepID=UPI00047319E0|nr:helix-turn-helix domain-containing protein [Herminiimonas sp. CN]